MKFLSDFIDGMFYDLIDHPRVSAGFCLLVPPVNLYGMASGYIDDTFGMMTTIVMSTVLIPLGIVSVNEYFTQLKEKREAVQAKEKA